MQVAGGTPIVLGIGRLDYKKVSTYCFEPAIVYVVVVSLFDV